EEYLFAKEIEKLVEGAENVENVEVDSFTLRQDDTQNVLDTRLEPMSNKESLEELTVNDSPPSYSTPSSSSSKLKLSATNQLLSLFKPKPGRFKRYKSFFEELQERYDYLFKHLKTRFMPRKKFNVLAQHLQEIMEESLPIMIDDRVKELTKTQVPVYVAHGLILERQQNQAVVVKMIANAKMIADAIQQERKNLRAEISSQINNAITNHIPSQVISSVRNYMSGHILHVHLTQATPASAQEQQYQLSLTMRDNPQLQRDNLPIWLALKYKFERLHVSNTPCRPSFVRPRDHDDPHDDAHPEGENSVKRENGSIMLITESGYKNINKNDNEDMYLVIVNINVDDYAETILLWSFIEKYKVFSITSKLVYGIIYKNNKKENRVTRHQEVHKFCDATLKRVLEGLKSYNNDVKHGYVTPSLSNEDVEYLQLFEEEIKERLKHRDQMRH
nr:hypothetical protein [Tanacetum cinerariifolium]